MATGTVASFDAATGLGEVRAENGTTYPFHATAIANGSRTIQFGEPVQFSVVLASGGRVEACDLTSLR